MALGRFTGSLRSAYRGWDVSARVERFERWIDRSTTEVADCPAYDHTETVNDYYDLCNQFMELGWGESLQFAPLASKETSEQAIARLQQLMISKLRLQEGMTVVDVGCGFGALMRRVARETGVRVVGINNNEHQLEEARRRNYEAGLDRLIDCIKCNMMDMSSIAAGSFDRGYAIESTCHTPDRVKAFAEIFRLLKPGALFWGQEMCMTDDFDPNSGEHQSIKQELMLNIALKEIPRFAEVNQALELADFEIIEATDRGVSESTVSWYTPMEGRYGTLSRRLIRGPKARKTILVASKMAEVVRILPRGSAKVVGLMDRAAEAYVKGGRAGIFTPLYCFLARKPA